MIFFGLTSSKDMAKHLKSYISLISRKEKRKRNFLIIKSLLPYYLIISFISCEPEHSGYLHHKT